MAAICCFVAALIAVTGTGLCMLGTALHGFSYAGAGPSDPDEPIRQLRAMQLFTGSIIGLGIIVGSIGIYLLLKSLIKAMDS